MNFENIKIKAGYIGNILQKDNLFSLMTEWLIILICFGYPLQAMFVFLLKTDSTPVNIAIRAVYLLISISLIFSTLWPNIKKVHWTFFIFIMFWILYGIRLVYDIQVKHLYYAWNNGYYVYAYAFGASLIPAAAVFLNGWRITSSRLFRNVFYVLIISNLFITIKLIIETGGRVFEIFRQRAEIFIQLGEKSVSLVNPITISFFGAIIALFSIWMILTWNRKVNSIGILILFILTFFLGLFNLMAGASKGPFLSFGIAIMGLLISRLYKYIGYSDHADISKVQFIERSKSFRVFMKRSILLISLGAIVTLVIILSWEKLKTTALVVRFAESQNLNATSSTSLRMNMWESAYNQFLARPFTGDSYLENFMHSYPHNVILESFMATGLIGGILYLIFLFQPFYLYSRLKRSQMLDLFPALMIFLSIFVVAMVSGGLFASPDIWMITAASIAIFHQEMKRSYNYTES